jgi:hypothetical protein
LPSGRATIQKRFHVFSNLFMRLLGLIFGFGGPLAALPVYIALHYSQMPTDMYP